MKRCEFQGTCFIRISSPDLCAIYISSLEVNKCLMYRECSEIERNANLDYQKLKRRSYGKKP